jgi:hypothetical protein
MKVPYVEDVANHSSPESCGGYGNVPPEALTGESVGGLMSSEITFIVVLTPCTEGEGQASGSENICELPATRRSPRNLACVETSHTKIRRSVRNPTQKSWNRGIQAIKISRCIESRLMSVQAKNTKPGRKYRMGQRRSNSVSLPHKVSRKSDNNIVPEKQTNKKGNWPLRSLWREGR